MEITGDFYSFERTTSTVKEKNAGIQSRYLSCLTVLVKWNKDKKISPRFEREKKKNLFGLRRREYWVQPLIAGIK